MQPKIWILGLALALGAAACGQTDLERGASGAAIGAGVAAATDNDVATGAAIGGLGGIFADDAGIAY